MQTGANRFLPSVLLNSSLPFHKGQSEARITALDTLSRMCGAFAVNGDITGLTREQVETLREWVGVYKSVRNILMDDFYPLTHQPRSPADWDSVEFISRSRKVLLVFAFRYGGSDTHQVVRLKELIPEAEYVVTDAAAGRKQGRRSGGSLMAEGLELELEENGACLMHLMAS
jgi:hypothetical protein